MKKSSVRQALYERYEAAISEEKEANKNRVEIENEIFTQIKTRLKKSEGQEILEDSGYSVTVNQPMNYKLDEPQYRELAESMPEQYQIHRVKLEIDKKKLDAVVSLADQAIVKKIQNCITATPGKAAIKIKKIEEE